MKLWMSGETFVDVGDNYRLVRKEVEQAINSEIGANDYGSGLEKWAFLAIILPSDYGTLEEIKKFHKRDKTAEFRLAIDYPSFKNAGHQERCRLLCDALHRSLVLLEQMEKPDIDVARLRSDFQLTVQKHGWS